MPEQKPWCGWFREQVPRFESRCRSNPEYSRSPGAAWGRRKCWRALPRQRRMCDRPGAAEKRNWRIPDRSRHRCQPGFYKVKRAAARALVGEYRRGQRLSPRRKRAERATDLAKALQKRPISTRKACALEHRGKVRKGNQGNALKTALNGARCP